MRAARGPAGLAAIVGSIALVAAMGAFAPSALAVTPQTRFVATSGNDSENDCTDQTNPCRTVVHAVEDEANPGDTVSVAAGTYAESVVITQDLTLVGASSTGPGRTTISGDKKSGDTSITVRAIDSPPTVTIKDLDVSDNGDSDGIDVEDANVMVEDCVVSANDAQGIRLEGEGTVSVTSGAVVGNGDDGILVESPPRAKPTAPKTDVALPHVDVANADLSDNGGSGIAAAVGSVSVDGSTINRNEGGGAIVQGASLDVTTTTLDSNTTFGVAGFGQLSTVTVTKSTVSNTKERTAVTNGGSGLGAGVLSFIAAPVTVDTSTVFGNTGQGVLSLEGDVTVNNSTVSGTIKPANEDSESGGVLELPYGGVVVAVPQITAVQKAAQRLAPHAAQLAPAATTVATAKVTGSIVADNTTLADCNTSKGSSVTDGGYNLDSDGSCHWSATGSISSGDAKLGPLADNGGPTKTLLPAKGSDAIDVIPTGAANCSSKVSDQRGVSRPQGAKCDIGAVEAAQPPIVITPNRLPHGVVGTPYRAHLHATGGLGAPYEFSLAPGSGSLPPGLTLSAAGKISGTPTQAGTFPITVSVDDPTTKNYTIVITAPSAPSSSASTEPIANTGANVTPLTVYGLLAVVIGALLTFGGIARYIGRHRAH